MFSVGHNQFPGLFESVYVVNAGWSQRALWNSVVRRVLPRYALDRLSFLNSREDIEAIFEMDKFPKGKKLGRDCWLTVQLSEARHHRQTSTRRCAGTRTRAHHTARPTTAAPDRAPTAAPTRVRARGQTRADPAEAGPVPTVATAATAEAAAVAQEQPAAPSAGWVSTGFRSRAARRR